MQDADRGAGIILIAERDSSVRALQSHFLEAAGYRVHVHTSPHLVAWHERYRLAAPGGGRLVEDKVFAEAIHRVAEANALATETLGAIDTVQSHAREAYERGRFASAV